MSENLKHATQLIEQGHVRVGPEVVKDPAFLVSRNLEDFVTWVDGSKIKEHVLRYNDMRDDFQMWILDNFLKVIFNLYDEYIKYLLNEIFVILQPGNCRRMDVLTVQWWAYIHLRNFFRINNTSYFSRFSYELYLYFFRNGAKGNL